VEQLILQQVVEVVVQELLVRVQLLQRDNLVDQVVEDQTHLQELVAQELRVKEILVVMDQV